MTDEQFETLRSIQFAQLAMLRSIEANIRLLAQQKKAPAGGTGVDWRATRLLLDGVLNWRKRNGGGA